MHSKTVLIIKLDLFNGKLNSKFIINICFYNLTDRQISRFLAQRMG